MTDDEIELAILRSYIHQHKTAEIADPERNDKCARELDMRVVLSKITDQSGAELDYEAVMWHGRLTREQPYQTSQTPLRACSDSRINNTQHRYHARAFTNGGEAPAWDRIRELEVQQRALARADRGLQPAEKWSLETNREADMKKDATLEHKTAPSDPSKVFVVHGRNEMARDALFQFLRAIALKPIEWSEAIRATGNPAPYVGEILDAAFSMAQAVVVLMTPDDMAYLREPLHRGKEPPHEVEPTAQARPNVLFEAGMALGRHPHRTVLVELGELRPFSDVMGRHAVRINNSTQRRQDLADRLALAECPVNLTDRDWHTAGAFDAALEGL